MRQLPSWRPYPRRKLGHRPRNPTGLSPAPEPPSTGPAPWHPANLKVALDEPERFSGSVPIFESNPVGEALRFIFGFANVSFEGRDHPVDLLFSLVREGHFAHLFRHFLEDRQDYRRR